jgi:hypothetical protein
MEGFDNLIAVFSSTDYKARFLNAKASAARVACHTTVRFLTASVRLEYSVSALCQECQERYFDGRTAVPQKAAGCAFT